MLIPVPTADSLRAGLADPLAEMNDAWALADQPARPGEAPVPALVEAFQQLFEAMTRTEASEQRSGATADGISELGEYALELFEQASGAARQLGLKDVSNTFQIFTITMAQWIAAHGGQLLTLEPIVDALAQTANSTQDPGQLLALYEAMTAIIAATAEAIGRDLEKSNPGRPWRLLHLNRAIVATRTHQPDVMETAFRDLTDRLPEDAPAFFSQGMEQMDLLNYPPHVREVMDRYYKKWSVKHSLH